MRKWVLITNQKLGMFVLLEISEISVKIRIDSRNLSVIWRCLTCEQKWNWYVYILCSYQPLTPLFFCQLKWKPSSNLWRPQSDLTLKIIPVVFTSTMLGFSAQVSLVSLSFFQASLFWHCDCKQWSMLLTHTSHEDDCRLTIDCWLMRRLRLPSNCSVCSQLSQWWIESQI